MPIQRRCAGLLRWSYRSAWVVLLPLPLWPGAEGGAAARTDRAVPPGVGGDHAAVISPA
jgi:hypothetical protein